MINKKLILFFAVLLLVISQVTATTTPPDFRSYDLAGTSFADGYKMACDDFNGDGLNEVVYSYVTGARLYVTKNLGGFIPSFLTQQIEGLSIGGMTANDFDDDGDVDVVYGATATDSIYLRTNDGFGNFPTSTKLSTGGGDLLIYDVDFFDIDEDGDKDLFYCSNNGLKWLRKTGVISFSAGQTINTSGCSRALAFGDFNGDGNTDIVGVGGTSIHYNQNQGLTEVFLSSPIVTFEGRTLNNSLPAQVEDVKVSDLDGDGDLDIVYSANNQLGFIANLGTINNFVQFSNPVSISSTASSSEIAIIDINNDDLDDIIVPSTNLELYVNYGNFEFSGYSVVDGQADVVTTCDLNNDDFIDLVEVNNTGVDYHLNFDGFCVEPALFCDDFEDVNSLISRDWIVLNPDNSINQSFKGNGSVLEWNTTNPDTIGYYSIKPFSVDYDISDNEKVTSSIYAPLFSVEFDLNIENSTNNTRLQIDTFDERNRLGTSLQFRVNGENVNVNWFNGSYENIGVFSANQSHKIKIEEYFGAKPVYNFNSTLTHNFIKVYVDGLQITNTYSSYRIDSLYLSTYQVFLSKDTNKPNIILDNYYHYVGNDRFEDTSTVYYQDFLDFESSELESGDFAETVDSIWDLMGLRTQTSKTMFGLIFLVVTILIISGVFLGTTHGNMSGLGLVLAIYSIAYTVLAVFVGLFPVWILLLFGVMGAGMLALGIALNINNGGA